MSILTSASSASVYRGYEYYDNGYVDTIKQLSEYEYEGYVKGSRKNPYYVKIDINHPRKSYCDCPFANGNTTCKHMVVLYFSIFPNEADDYNEWHNSDYYDDEDENEYYDNYYDNYYDDSRYRKESFNKPLFFDTVLDDFISNLDEVDLRKILKEMKMVEQKGLGFEPIYERNNITDDLHDLFNFNTDLEIVNYKKMKKILNIIKE